MTSKSLCTDLHLNFTNIFRLNQMFNCKYLLKFQCRCTIAGPYGRHRTLALLTSLLVFICFILLCLNVCGPQLSFRTAGFLARRFSCGIQNFCQVPSFWWYGARITGQDSEWACGQSQNGQNDHNVKFGSGKVTSVQYSRTLTKLHTLCSPEQNSVKITPKLWHRPRHLGGHVAKVFRAIWTCGMRILWHHHQNDGNIIF